MPPKRKRAAPSRQANTCARSKKAVIPRDAHRDDETQAVSGSEEGLTHARDQETADLESQCKRQKLATKKTTANEGETTVGDGHSDQDESGNNSEKDREDDHDQGSKTSGVRKSTKGKTCELKSYPKQLQGAIKSKRTLHANRRGIISLHCNTKPTLECSELIKQCRLGLSYKQIGCKLGIDPHKEDVIQVYIALGIDIQQVKGPSKVTPPTPLWYLFDSEREVIKDSVLPSTSAVLQLLPQERISSRLGDNSGFLLATYLKVAEIIDEEVQVAVS